MPEPLDTSDPQKAAFHVRRVFDLVANLWEQGLRSGSLELQSGAKDALDAVNKAARHLPRVSPAPAPKDGLDLSDLAALESVKPYLAELRAVLGKALSIAERIDEARGRSYPEPIGGSCGFDLAEDVNQLLARVELEIEGPGRRKGLE